jgi:hypothetical protein
MGKQDSEASESVTSHSNAETGCQQRNGLLLIPSVRECGLVRSAHTLTLSSAHVPSHCNRALLMIKQYSPIQCSAFLTTSHHPPKNSDPVHFFFL